MKVVALNGSARLIGNTTNILNEFLDDFDREGIETEQIQLYAYDFAACNDCRTCELRGDGRCADEDDGLNELIDELRAADAVVLASPAYAGGATAVMRLFLERVQLTLTMGDMGLRGKIGGAISVCGHDGGESTYRELCMWMLMNGMNVVGSYPLPVFRALNSPMYEKDGDAMRGIHDLSANMIRELELRQRE